MSEETQENRETCVSLVSWRIIVGRVGDSERLNNNKSECYLQEVPPYSPGYLEI